MKQIDIQYVIMPVGEMILGSYEGKLCLADWRYRTTQNSVDQRLKNSLYAEYVERENALLIRTREQIDAYFKGERTVFDIPLLIAGTDFQKSVWKELMHIPYGQTLSYLELSKKVGHEKAVRAVASAVGSNALSIIIPCHRIVGSDGSLRGYAGGLAAKEKLLDLESHLITL